MTYEDFIKLINRCPVCDKHMEAEKLDLIKNFSGSPNNLSVVSLTCMRHALHYESYSCLKEFVESDNIKITTISMHMNMYSVSWFDDTKEFCLRNPFAEIILRKEFPDKTSMDWLMLPYKNIISKGQAFMLLK